jgi:hypothetical protein
MLLGRLTKLFRLRSKDVNEDKQPISSGSAPSLRLQARKPSTSKEHRPDKEGSTTSLLNPSKDNTLRFFKRKRNAGSCLIDVPLTSNSSKLLTFPKFCGIYILKFRAARQIDFFKGFQTTYATQNAFKVLAVVHAQYFYANQMTN